MRRVGLYEGLTGIKRARSSGSLGTLSSLGFLLTCGRGNSGNGGDVGDGGNGGNGGAANATPPSLELYDEDAPTELITGLTNKKKLKLLKVKLALDASPDFEVNLYEGGTNLLKSVTLTEAHVTVGFVSVTLDSAFTANKEYHLTAKLSERVDGEDKEGNAGAPLIFTLDTTPPDAPEVSLSGGVEVGGITYTRNTTPTLTIGGLETGSRVNVHIRGSDTVIGSGLVEDGTSVDVTVSSSLEDGVTHIVVKEVDSAGNEGDVSAAVTFTVDTTAPSAPTLGFDDGVNVRDVGNMKYTKASNFVFAFSGLVSDAGGLRKLYLKASNGDLILLGASTGGDDVTVTGSRFAGDGIYRVVGKVEDHAGNESEESAVLTFTVDRTAPTLSSAVATVNSSYVLLTFSEAILLAEESRFVVNEGTFEEAVVGALLDAGDPTKVRLFVNHFAIESSESYAVRWSAGAVADRAGNEILGRAKALGVTKEVLSSADTTSPKLILHGHSSNTLSLIFDEKIRNDETGLTTNNIKLYSVGSGGVETSVTFGIDFSFLDDNNVSFLLSGPLTLTRGIHYRLKLSAGTVEDVSGNENGATVYDWVEGGAVRLSSEGLTLVDDHTLRVSFAREIEEGPSESIVVVRWSGSVYEVAPGSFTTEVAGKDLTITTANALENDVTYRVYIGKWSVRDKAWGDFSGYELRTEGEEYDVVPLVLDTTRGGGIVAGERLIKVFFDDDLRVVSGKTLSDEVSLKESDGTSVGISSVLVKGSTLQITATLPLESGKQYRVEIDDGSIEDGGGNVLMGLDGLTKSGLAMPSEGGPVVSEIEVSRIELIGGVDIATVTLTFDEEIGLLDSDNFASTLTSKGGAKSVVRGGFRVLEDGDGVPTKLVFTHETGASDGPHSLTFTLGEGFVSEGADEYSWNGIFSHTIGGFDKSSGATWTRPSGSEWGDVFVGLGVTSEADYGF
jgi:hypothetical protein